MELSIIIILTVIIITNTKHFSLNAIIISQFVLFLNLKNLPIERKRGGKGGRERERDSNAFLQKKPIGRVVNAHFRKDLNEALLIKH